jgi:hypothetical protein
MWCRGLALVIVLLVLAAGSGCATKTTVSPLFVGPKSFAADLASGKVASVKADTTCQTLSVKLTDGSTYETAYPELKTLDRMMADHPGVSYSVDGKVRQ